MAITFNEIPINLKVPGAYGEIDSSRAIQGLAPLPNRTLIIGSKLAAGSASGSTAYQITNTARAEELFGTGSQLAHMVKTFKAANTIDEVWASGLADDGGAANTIYSVNFSGSAATEAGTVHLMVAGRKLDVAVSSGDTAADIVDTMVATAENRDYAFTFADSTLSGTLTSRHAGAFTDDLDVRVNYYEQQKLPAGVSLSISKTQSGTTNPDVQDALDLIPDEWFTRICVGYDDSSNLATLESHAETQWGPTVQRDTMIFTAVPGTYSDASTWGASRNSKFSTAIATAQSPTPAYEWASSYCAVDAKEPDPARPRNTLRLPGILPAARTARFSFSERNLLLQGGVTTHRVDQGNNVRIERAITTFQTNDAGTEDETFLDTTTLFTLAAIRYTTNARITSKYPRHKLVSDGALIPPGQPMVSPSTIKAEFSSLYNLWEELGWVEGSAKSQFLAELLVERSNTDVNRIDAILPPNLANAFHTLAYQIQFLL